MDSELIKWLRGEATPEEIRALEAWRRADPANDRLAREFDWLWRLAGEVEPPVGVVAPNAARGPAVLPGPAARHGRGIRERNRFGERSRTALIGIAAAVTLLVVGTLAQLRPWDGEPVSSVAEFRTGADEMATVHLSDGTAIRLAPSSLLRFEGEPGGRPQVWLEGRAFFGVPPRGRERAFTVRTPAGDAQVLGTRFDLDVDGRNLQLAVLDGRVALTTPVGNVDVAGGTLSRVAPGSGPVVEPLEDPAAVTEWMGRSMIFQNNSVQTVAEEIARRHGVQIRIEDPALGRETVTASFTDESLEEVLGVLCRLLVARCSTQGGVVTLGR